MTVDRGRVGQTHILRQQRPARLIEPHRLRPDPAGSGSTPHHRRRSIVRQAGSPLDPRGAVTVDRGHYQKIVDDFTDWTMTRADDLLAQSNRPPLVVPMTVTFQIGAVRPDRILLEFERLYVRICRLLMNNPDRPSKRRLLPFVIAFRDDPSTRPEQAEGEPPLDPPVSGRARPLDHGRSIPTSPTASSRWPVISRASGGAFLGETADRSAAPDTTTAAFGSSSSSSIGSEE